MDYHLTLGILSGILQAVSIVPYIRSMLKGETRPNAVTWFVWLILQIIAVLAQVSSGASWSVIILVVMIFNISLVLVLIFFGYGYSKYEKIDYICFILAIFSLILWQSTGEPILAIILAVLTDLFAIIPTISKTYKEPRSENLFSWILNVIAAILALLSTTIIDLANVVFPVYYIITDSFMVYLIYRGGGRRNNVPMSDYRIGI